jgi:hypothetical protein
MSNLRTVPSSEIIRVDREYFRYNQVQFAHLISWSMVSKFQKSCFFVFFQKVHGFTANKIIFSNEKLTHLGSRMWKLPLLFINQVHILQEPSRDDFYIFDKTPSHKVKQTLSGWLRICPFIELRMIGLLRSWTSPH